MSKNELDNSGRSQHGQNAIKSLEQIIDFCKEKRLIKHYEKKYTCGYEGCDPNQFYCNFLITFFDDSKWIINITTSFRHDRVKEQQWDSFHIKQIDHAISKSVLIYPDGIEEKELKNFKNYKTKISQKKPVYYSAIDDVLSQNEVHDSIVEYGTSQLNKGQQKDLIGNNFESMIASVLSDSENFERWIADDGVKVGVQYNVFKKIVDFLLPDVDKCKILRIDATSDKKIIGNLESGGNPKTDVIVYVKYRDSNRNEDHYTISCKKTNEKSVSVHQYDADAFADVLNPEDTNLRNLLREFQVYGNLRDFGDEKKSLLTEALNPYMESLVRWVLGGFGGKIRSNDQLAEYVLISDDTDIYIHTIDQYTGELLNPENIVHFGTPFSWTYASKRKGKDIQLKCKIIK